MALIHYRPDASLSCHNRPAGTTEISAAAGSVLVEIAVVIISLLITLALMIPPSG